MTLSQGAKKDLLVINLALAVLSVRHNDDVKLDTDLIMLTNKTHRLNRKIEAICITLEKKLRDTMHEVISSVSDSMEVARFLRKKWALHGVELLLSINTRTNIQLLCNQILFYNFCDRDKKLIDNYKWLSNEKQHYEMFDLLAETDAVEAIESTNEDAIRLIKIIREK